MADLLLSTVIEIKELLKLIAEPQLALRDEKRRSSLREIVGKSAWKRKMIPLLDGSKTQTELRQEVKVDASDLSKLIKALRASDLLKDGEAPHLAIEIPVNFFESEEAR
jgi:hypothetical protein